jgi:hypothetical protein
MVQHILAVDVDGSGHVLTRSIPYERNETALQRALEAQRQVTYVLMDPQGTVRLSSTPTPPSTYSFPDGPVPVGDGWEFVTQFPLPPSGQVAHVPFIYTLREVTLVNGSNCAVIEVTAPRNDWEVPLPDSQDIALVSLETRGVIYFDYERGYMIHSEMETTTAPRLGPQTVTTITSTVQELIAAD